ncbi:hypothetical protein WT60_29170 [Burkholderia sp. MSMB617WGS]|nr:hypothetical protein WS78_27380 [Burkholderia savannae]AOK50827.1 hypothetical protein WT60_29170 [Burkholderia sp. MSMB617WGS]KVG46239.1 hypothetical protein WS77_31310 [Burkholderia sp. MSMB0265]KVG89613.1 hypothetical protein WS81_21480 [Burkholderia sp. MSMB2040]KVG91766.1 hypothetical protein WS82_14245 [Burkholderia sp. MSMB2041]KVK71554.1 hypothetical protein WS91_23980 [Burkholderia sp. MSMB1498]
MPFTVRATFRFFADSSWTATGYRRIRPSSRKTGRPHPRAGSKIGDRDASRGARLATSGPRLRCAFAPSLFLSPSGKIPIDLEAIDANASSM